MEFKRQNVIVDAWIPVWKSFPQEYPGWGNSLIASNFGLSNSDLKTILQEYLVESPGE